MKRKKNAIITLGIFIIHMIGWLISATTYAADIKYNTLARLSKLDLKIQAIYSKLGNHVHDRPFYFQDRKKNIGIGKNLWKDYTIYQ